MRPLIQNGHVGTKRDFILSGVPQWPLPWNDSLAVGMIWPWSTGEIICDLVEPGHLLFRRTRM